MLSAPEGHPGGALPEPSEAMAAILGLKTELTTKGEASDLFARLSRPDGLDAILGNLDQTVMGEPAYPTVESRAAHLLYFMVKNHPFVDGNKRCGAFLFVDFLHRNSRLMKDGDIPVINDTGLAALTLLVAESEKMSCSKSGGTNWNCTSCWPATPHSSPPCSRACGRLSTGDWGTGHTFIVCDKNQLKIFYTFCEISGHGN